MYIPIFQIFYNEYIFFLIRNNESKYIEKLTKHDGFFLEVQSDILKPSSNIKSLR